jgi:hypothetical protein
MSTVISTDVWINLTQVHGISAGGLQETPPAVPLPTDLRQWIARRYHVTIAAVGQPCFLSTTQGQPRQRRGIDIILAYIETHGGTLQPCILIEEIRDLDVSLGSLCVTTALRSRVHYVVQTADGTLRDVIPTTDTHILIVPVTGLEVSQRYTRETVANASSLQDMIEHGLVDLDGIMCLVRLATVLRDRRPEVIRLFLQHPELGPIAQHSWTTSANLITLAEKHRWCWNAGVGPKQHAPCQRGHRCCAQCLEDQHGPGYRLDRWLSTP